MKHQCRFCRFHLQLNVTFCSERHQMCVQSKYVVMLEASHWLKMIKISAGVANKLLFFIISNRRLSKSTMAITASNSYMMLPQCSVKSAKTQLLPGILVPKVLQEEHYGYTILSDMVVGQFLHSYILHTFTYLHMYQTFI